MAVLEHVPPSLNLAGQALNWIALTLIAGLFLGLYDIAKKQALTGNAVPPVLLFNVLTGALLWAGPVVWAASFPGIRLGPVADQIVAELRELGPRDHGLLFLKSLLVGSSWFFAFFALKHLPISVAAPIRATSPVWTFFLAVAWLGERPAVAQWAGVVLIMGSFVAISRVGRGEGVKILGSPWVGFMVLATMISTACALYDKYLLQNCHYTPAVVQAWFSIYLVPVMLIPAAVWSASGRARSRFQWRWSIPWIAVLLLAADFAYYSAVCQEGALISVISPLRRVSVLVPFWFGVTALGEAQWKVKLSCILALLAGVALIALNG